MLNICLFFFGTICLVTQRTLQDSENEKNGREKWHKNPNVLILMGRAAGMHYKLDVKLTLDIKTNKLFQISVYMVIFVSLSLSIALFVVFRLHIIKVTTNSQHKMNKKQQQTWISFFGQNMTIFFCFSSTLSRSIRCDFYGIFFNCCHYILRQFYTQSEAHTHTHAPNIHRKALWICLSITIFCRMASLA